MIGLLAALAYLAAIVAVYCLFYLGILFVPKVWATALALSLVGVFVFGDKIARFLPSPDSVYMLIGMATAGATVGALIRVLGPQGKRDANYWIAVAIIGAPVGFCAMIAGASASYWILHGA